VVNIFFVLSSENLYWKFEFLKHDACFRFHLAGTGLPVVYDERNLQHRFGEDDGHPERPARASTIMKKLNDDGSLFLPDLSVSSSSCSQL
jgi:hypothetical protein